MKNIRLAGVVGLLCIFLLAGCGNKTGDNSISGSDSSGDVSQSQEMTAEQLHQYFRQAFDTKGNALDTPEQLALELSEIENLSVDTTLPEDFEAQYKQWRTKQVEALLKPLYAEYDKIIAGLSLNSGPIPGACYAEYIDFEYDGIPELFVLSLEQIPNYDGMDSGLSFVMEVYGSNGEHTEKLGEEHISAWISDSVGLCKSGKLTTLHAWHYAGKGDDGSDDYYGIKDGIFTAIDRVSRSDPAGSWINENDYDYTSFDKTVSMDEYLAVQSKYSETDIIASLDYTTPLVNSRGILPAPSSDVLRRAALLEALNNISGLKYAKLLDTNKDNVEELIVLYAGNNQGYGERYYFRVCSWNGEEVQSVDLNKVTDPEITACLGLGTYGIYREKTSGNIYMKYSVEIAGGWGGTLFINETDFKFYSEPFFPSDPESDYDDDWEADYKEYEADLNQYEAIEEINLYMNDYASTISAVRQSLMEG